jgi:hypothetical protein
LTLQNLLGALHRVITFYLYTCISNTDNTLATKKRQAITGVRQKASTAHSSITTTLMDWQATKPGGPPRPPRGFFNIFIYGTVFFFTENLPILQFYIYNFYIYIQLKICIRNTKSKYRCTTCNISTSNRVVQRIRCIKDSPLKYLILYLT